MKIKFITFICFILFIVPAISSLAGNENDETGGRFAGMSFASMCLQDPWAVLGNQAGFAKVQKITGGIYYENRFLIKETGHRAGVIILPTRSGNFGIGISNFGFSAYNKSLFGLAFARTFGNRISVGIKLNYFLQKYGNDWPSTSCLSFDIGIQTELTGQLTLGVHVSNPLSIHFSREQYTRGSGSSIPAMIRLGLSYLFTEKVIVTLQADKDIYHDVNFRCGTELKLLDGFFIRAGITTKPFTNSFGAGYTWKKLTIDFAGHMHYILGYTLQMSFQYALN